MTTDVYQVDNSKDWRQVSIRSTRLKIDDRCLSGLQVLTNEETCICFQSDYFLFTCLCFGVGLNFHFNSQIRFSFWQSYNWWAMYNISVLFEYIIFLDMNSDCINGSCLQKKVGDFVLLHNVFQTKDKCHKVSQRD